MPTHKNLLSVSTLFVANLIIRYTDTISNRLHKDNQAEVFHGICY